MTKVSNERRREEHVGRWVTTPPIITDCVPVTLKSYQIYQQSLTIWWARHRQQWWQWRPDTWHGKKVNMVRFNSTLHRNLLDMAPVTLWYLYRQKLVWCDPGGHLWSKGHSVTLSTRNLTTSSGILCLQETLSLLPQQIGLLWGTSGTEKVSTHFKKWNLWVPKVSHFWWHCQWHCGVVKQTSHLYRRHETSGQASIWI